LVNVVGGYYRKLMVFGLRCWQLNMGLKMVRWIMEVVEPLVDGKLFIVLGLGMRRVMRGDLVETLFRGLGMVSELYFGRIDGWMGLH
jgi:hypothetical protein